MDALEAILTRKSFRVFKDEPVSDEQIETLLKAAMRAPSAMNEQPWHFIVIRDRELLDKLSTVHKGAKPLSLAPVSILICADMTQRQTPDSWSLDCANAATSILLTAHILGLGGVWTAIYPTQERIAGVRSFIELPEHIIPICNIPIGYPGEEKELEYRFKTERIHNNKW